jgi:hypothetical protein
VFLPGGEEVAFTIGTMDKPGDYDNANIDAVSLGTGKRRRLVSGASMLRIGRGGQWILGRDGQLLLAAPEGKGDAVSVLRGVGGVAASGAVYFDVAANGTLVYAERNPEAALRELTWVGRDGSSERLPLPARQYSFPSVSPDGKYISVCIGPGRGRGGDVWVHELASGTFSRLTFENNCNVPVWGPGVHEVTYTVIGPEGDCFAVKPAGGGGAARTIQRFKGNVARALTSWSPDRKRAIFLQENPGMTVDLHEYDATSGTTRVLLQSPVLEIEGMFAPDGKSFAFTSSESGRLEVYVQSYPEATGRWQVSEGGGVSPVWSPDGSELFYVLGHKMMSVAVRPGPRFAPPRELFETTFEPQAESFSNYHVAPDGRFLVVRGTSAESYAQHLNVITNWVPSPASDPRGR